MSKRDILQRLQDDARRLRVARKLPDGTLSWDWIKRVQTDFNLFMDSSGLSLSSIAKKMGKGFSVAVLSQFSNLSSDTVYIGDRDRIVRGINQFMETEARRHESARPEGWIETKIAARMISVIQKTIELRSIGLIYSDAGRGKTMTMQAASEIYTGAVLIRTRSTTRTVSGLARQLAKALKLRGVYTARDIQDAVIDLFKGSDRPLMIDEAHQLNLQALEFIRDIHDECAIPVILAGTRLINEKCCDTDMFFGQFTSRIAMRYDVTEHARRGGKSKALHSVAEIKKLYERDKLRLTDTGRLMLTKLANILGMGGLRLCTKIMQVAPAAAGDELVGPELILRVLRELHGLEYAIDRIERALDSPATKVA